MNLILLPGNQPALSYTYFGAYGIPRKTVEYYVKTKPESVHYEEGKCFVKWAYIPKTTLQKLPRKEVVIAECVEETQKQNLLEIEQLLRFAFSKGFLLHVPHYRKAYDLAIEKATECAQLHAVWQFIIDQVNEGNKKTRAMYDAYTLVVTCRPLTYFTFQKDKGLAVKHGAEYMAIDGRLFNSLPESQRISEVNKLWATGLISIGKKYNNRQVWEKLCKLCEQQGEKAPSLKWVEKYRKDVLKNVNVYQARYGQEKTKGSKLPYASIQEALHANSQWQMDGWNMPFWVQGEKGFYRYVMVIVRDSHSKKIVGYSVGKSENTLLIMAALQNAVINTGCLPFEMVADNHSFNETKEASYFKTELDRRKLLFTVTSNPQWKAIIERYNQHLDAECMDYHGYLGKGIKSKSDDARPKPEMIEVAAKNQLSVAEVTGIAAAIVERFNEKPRGKLNISPNQQYAESEQPYSHKVDVFERLQVLTPRTDSLVRRGQINITRGGEKYEFQLPAALYGQYNDTTVHVRYEDLSECIYLYDIDTDAPIDSVQRKAKIHGAKADQTEADTELYFKNSGRIKGILHQAGKTNADKIAAGLEANPEAMEHLREMTIPKSIIQEARQNADIRKNMRDQGIDPDTLHIPERKTEIDSPDFKEGGSRQNASIFQPKTVAATLQKVNLKDLLKDDE